MRRFLTLLLALLLLPGAAPSWALPGCGDEATACCPCDPSEAKLVCCCTLEPLSDDAPGPASAPVSRNDSSRDGSMAPPAAPALITVDRNESSLCWPDPRTEFAHVDIPLFLRHSSFLI